MLFHSLILGALPLSVYGYGREVTNRIGFPVLIGDFLKNKNPNLVCFHEISIVFNYEGLDVVFTVYLLFFWKGGEVSFVIWVFRP